MKTVSFKQMKHGSKEDYLFLDEMERQYINDLPNRLLAALKNLDNSMSGYQVSRLEHSLQTATRAENDGADEEMIIGALLHDIGDGLAPANHGEYAATILRPYVREEVCWIVERHPEFQLYYYGHHLGLDRNLREQYRNHRWFSQCLQFCEDWDQASFDPDYPTKPLKHFAPLVHKIFTGSSFKKSHS